MIKANKNHVNTWFLGGLIEYLSFSVCENGFNKIEF